MISVFIYNSDKTWLTFIQKSVTEYIIKTDWDIKIQYITSHSYSLLQHLSFEPASGAIYFLDITPDSSVHDLETAQEIRRLDSNAHIIFITKYDCFIMEIFRLKISALDYILKNDKQPKEKILQCLNHIEKNMLFSATSCQYSFSFREENVYRTIMIQKIYFIESIKNTHKVCLHTNNKKYIFLDSLTSIKQKVKKELFQCHKSCLVNLSHIESLDFQTHFIYLDNGEHCVCSFREWKNLINNLPASFH